MRRADKMEKRWKEFAHWFYNFSKRYVDVSFSFTTFPICKCTEEREREWERAKVCQPTIHTVNFEHEYAGKCLSFIVVTYHFLSYLAYWCINHCKRNKTIFYWHLRAYKLLNSASLLIYVYSANCKHKYKLSIY